MLGIRADRYHQRDRVGRWDPPTRFHWSLALKNGGKQRSCSDMLRGAVHEEARFQGTILTYFSFLCISSPGYQCALKPSHPTSSSIAVCCKEAPFSPPAVNIPPKP